MIRFITGNIQFVEDDAVVVNNQGIGYAVHVPARVMEALQPGGEVSFYTYQHVREDSVDLFGFQDRADLALFRQLISVSGVGPRLALSVLSAASADDVKRAIIHGDVTFLTSIPGVGKKTAERVVLDLKEVVGILPDQAVGTAVVREQMNTIDALLSLGYSRSEAFNALQHVNADDGVEEQVRQALRQLSGK